MLTKRTSFHRNHRTHLHLLASRGRSCGGGGGGGNSGGRRRRRRLRGGRRLADLGAVAAGVAEGVVAAELLLGRRVLAARQQLGDQTASGAPFRYREALRSGNGHVSSKSRLCRDGFGLAWSD